MEPSYEGSKNPTLELISKLRAFRITLTTHNIKLNTYIYLFLWKVKACNYLQLHQNPFMSFTAPLWTSKKQKLNPRSPEKSSPIKDQTCLQNMTIIYHRSLFCSKISSIIPKYHSDESPCHGCSFVGICFFRRFVPSALEKPDLLPEPGCFLNFRS